jgi:tetratricopeptide (TPR) repeat protein/transglutaminase-like putative cysteine protease
MFKWIFLAIVCLFPRQSVYAQDAVVPTKQADLSKEAFVFEDVSTKVAFEDDGTGSRETKVELRLSSDAGVQQFRILTLPYQEAVETIDIPYVRVKKADGSIVVTSGDNVQDMPAQITRDAPFYSDLREKQITVRGLSVGDLLEYDYRVRLTKPLAPGQFWFDYNFYRDGIALHEQVEISVPRERPIKYKSPEVTPLVVEVGQRRVYTWITKNLSPRPEQGDRVKSDQTSRGKLPLADLRLTSFKSWQEVGRWYSDLQQERVKPSPEIQAKSAELIKGASDDEAKLHALYNYVSLQFHYIGIAFGIGRYQPHSAADVLANQFGDCKDKHTLLAALAGAAGIKVYPALIGTSHDLDPDVPSPSQFDHVISVVTRGKELVWLDTTPEVAPYGFLLEPLRGKTALVIAGDNLATLETTPLDPPFKSVQNFNIRGKLSDEATFDAVVEVTNRGDVEYLLRSAFRRLPQAQWKDLVQSISYLFGFGGTVADVEADSPDTTANPFRFSYKYHRTNYGDDWQDHQITAPMPTISLPRLKDDDQSTTNPIWLSSPKELRFHSEMQLPKEWIPSLPANVTINHDFAEYRSSHRFLDGIMSTDVSLTTKLASVPLAEAGKYKLFVKSIEDDRSRYIPLTKYDAETGNRNGLGLQSLSELPDSTVPEANEYSDTASAQARRRDYAGMVETLKKAVKADPKFLRAWLMLGSGSVGLSGPRGKEDSHFTEGLNALHTAISIDPKQPLPYRLLGAILSAKHYHEDAVKVWQQLADMDLGDADARIKLGDSLFELKRYADAATAYAQANALVSSPHILFQQGSSYLRSGNQDKAFAIFEEYLEQSPDPDAKNDVAYELAEASAKLPEALRYAQQAVNETEEDSEKVKLTDLKKEDLQRDRKLHMFWDTLGWVYFRSGNLADAEQYIKAAWSLSQDPTEADHLGQVYEQQHRRLEAIHFYRLALASDEAQPDAAQRLSRLTGARTSNTLTYNPAEELSRMRSTQLPRVVTGAEHAEFFLLVAPGPKVEQIKFVSGSEKLRTPSVENQMHKMQLKVFFPKDSLARVVLQGILSCYQMTGCSFVSYPIQTMSFDHLSLKDGTGGE